MRLKLATFNFWGLPWPFSVYKHTRLKKLVELIKEQQFDVIAFQELWLNYDLNFLARQLAGYHFCDNRNFAYNHSGLYIGSKYPPSSVMGFAFNTPLFTGEFPSKKGVLRAEIIVDGKTIQLINTHVYYSSTVEQANRQKTQLDQLIKILSTEPTFLFGDFNHQFDMIRLPPHFFAISETSHPSIELKNPYADKRLNKINSSDRLPDFIFANFPVQVVKNYFIEQPILSDHFPMVSEVEL